MQSEALKMRPEKCVMSLLDNTRFWLVQKPITTHEQRGKPAGDDGYRFEYYFTAGTGSAAGIVGN